MHVTYNDAHLHNCRPSEQTVVVGNGIRCKPKFKGELVLRMEDGEMLLLHNVPYVPGFHKHIVSVGMRLKHVHDNMTATRQTLILSLFSPQKTIHFKQQGQMYMTIATRRAKRH